MTEARTAIDVHAHFGGMGGFPQTGKEKELISPTLEETEKRFANAGIGKVILSHADGLYPYGGRTVLWANEELHRLAMGQEPIYQWVIINPLIPGIFEQAERLLNAGKTVGIKLHPDAHGYHIRDWGDKIFRFTARFGAAVETHSGGPLSPPEDYVVYADRYPGISILLSHLGNNCDGDVTHQIRAVQSCRHQNLYTDVSSAKSLLPGLIEWAVKEIGAQKILFGTDYPLHDPAMMKTRVETADIPDQDKEQILHKNAEALFKKVIQ